jgi:hypothetical protein
VKQHKEAGQTDSKSIGVDLLLVHAFCALFLALEVACVAAAGAPPFGSGDLEHGAGGTAPHHVTRLLSMLAPAPLTLP